MAEKTDADLLVELGVSMERMNRQLAQAEARFNKTALKIEKDFNRANRRSIESSATAVTQMQSSFARLGTVAGTVLGVIIGQGLLQVAANARRSIKTLADLADAADRVGANIEEFQGLQFGFQLAGIENAEFVRAMEIFTQRIGEAAEGSGELEDRLRAAGIRIRDAQGNIRPMTDLLRDYATAVQKAGNESTRMAMLNDAFGRSGRELALAMREGAAGLDAMIVAAREAGVVLEEGVVRRAAELDDRLDVVTQQAQVLMQTLAVYGGEAALGLAQIAKDVLGIGSAVRELDEILKSNRNAAQVLGLDIANAMDAAGDATEAQATAARQMISVYNQLSGQATTLALELENAAAQADLLGETSAGDALRRIAYAMQEADRAFMAGGTSAEEFNARLTRMTALAYDVLAPLESIEGANFDSAAASISRMAIALYDAAVQAATLRANLPTYTPQLPTGGPGTFPVGDNSGNFSSPTPDAPLSVPSPPSRPDDIDFGYTPPETGSGSGRSSGGSAASQQPEWWDELVEKVREGEQAFEDYRAEVERGADALQDFFTSILDGSKSAKEALADLLRQLAEAQLRKALLGLGESGGWVGQAFSSLGQALSFDGGGYTGAGARSGGIDGRGGFPAILHPNETVIDHSRGQSAGGGQVSVVVRMEGGNLVPVIESVSGSVTARAMQAYDRQLPLRVRQIGGDRRAI